MVDIPCALRRLAAPGLAAALLGLTAPLPSAALGEPVLDELPAVGEPVAVLAGGCFWGVEGVFEHVAGVSEVVSGYAGGDAETAVYRQVSSGRTDHAEAVRIRYDPERVTYGQLLEVFFSVAHDPTQRDRQGPDRGRQYRSAIFYVDDEQRQIAESYIAELDRSQAFSRPIVTEVSPLAGFYPAEAYHQDYMARHPRQPYIVVHDLPKLEALKRALPELYRAR